MTTGDWLTLILIIAGIATPPIAWLVAKVVSLSERVRVLEAEMAATKANHEDLTKKLDNQGKEIQDVRERVIKIESHAETSANNTAVIRKLLEGHK